MVRHVVLLSLKPGATTEQRRFMLDGLEGLPGAIRSIRAFSFGSDLEVNDGNAHVAVTADFDDVEGYVEYRDHALHQQVIRERIVPILAGRQAVQYEL